MSDHKSSRPRAFFYHYNRPASVAAGKPQISIHHSGRCHIVDRLDCKAPARSRIRQKQPRFVMAGSGHLQIEDGVAVITS